MATWYRQDGSSAVGNADAYHVHRYRLRGMTLKPPTTTSTIAPAIRGATMPHLARRVLHHLGHGDRWDGTPSELAASGVGAGFSAEGLSRAFFAPKVSVALASAGVTVARGYRGKERVLRLERR
jgi:hypothetical protein